MFFDIWKEEVIEKAKKEAKALRKKNKKREKQNIRKEIQAGELVKIETRNVRFFINTKHGGRGCSHTMLTKFCPLTTYPPPVDIFLLK